PGPADRDVPDLRQAQFPAGQHLEPGVGREPDRLPAVLPGPEPGRPGLWPLALAGDGGEEVPVRRVQVRRVVEHHPRAPERPGQCGALARGRVEAVVVPELRISIILTFYSQVE